MLAVASVNYEFPAVVGGVVGLIATILFARFGIGLERRETAQPRQVPLLSRPVLVALTPLIVTVVILLVTLHPHSGSADC
jgi:lactate permease